MRIRLETLGLIRREVPRPESLLARAIKDTKALLHNA